MRDNTGNTIVICLILFCALCVVVCDKPKPVAVVVPVVQETPFHYVPSQYESWFITEINIARVRRGLQPVAPDHKLNRQAQKDVDTVITNNMVTTVNLAALPANQAMYIGDEFPREIVAAWIRNNKFPVLLSPDVKHAGWGYGTVHAITQAGTKTTCINCVRFH